MGGHGSPGWGLWIYPAQLLALGMFFGFASLLALGAILIRPIVEKSGSRKMVRRVLGRIYGTYFELLRWMRIVDIDVSALDAMRNARGLILAPNHPSLVDALLIASRVPDVACILRSDLMRNPIFGPIAALAGYVPNDVGAEMVRQCQRQIAVGENILIFPEGTRTRLGRGPVNPFRGGFALVAIKAGAPVQTLLVEREGKYFAKGVGLWQLLPGRVRLRIVPGERFSVRYGESPREFCERIEAYFRNCMVCESDQIRIR